MNNGVNNTNTLNTSNNTGGLAPMAGVKIAPVIEGPVDASKKETSVVQQPAPVVMPEQQTIPQNPVQIQPQTQIQVQPQVISPPPAIPTNPAGTTPMVQTPVSQQTIQPNIQVSPTETNETQKRGVLSIAEAKQKAYETPTLTPLPNASVTLEEPEPKNKNPQPIVNIPNNTNTKKGISIVPLILVIIISGFIIFYLNNNNNKKIAELRYNCTPITASKDEIKLDVNSTLVQSLYNKVATNIREDIGQPNFNDDWKLYIAYRQILETEKYDSNCNLFNPIEMEPYTCNSTNGFIPKAFKEETLIQKIKELYGENISIPLKNIQLGKTCMMGFQYIKERGEFVEGNCNQKTATSFKVNKTLKSAISTRNTIVLTEEVRYIESEGMTLPSYLKSGTYHYTFRLDLNYNYVLISKTYEEKY